MDTNQEINKTIVYLTPEEGELFVHFQKRFTFMQLLNSLGVFSLKSGSITINFDGMGQIGSVEKREFLRIDLPKKQEA